MHFSKVDISLLVVASSALALVVPDQSHSSLDTRATVDDTTTPQTITPNKVEVNAPGGGGGRFPPYYPPPYRPPYFPPYFCRYQPWRWECRRYRRPYNQKRDLNEEDKRSVAPTSLNDGHEGGSLVARDLGFDGDFLFDDIDFVDFY